MFEKKKNDREVNKNVENGINFTKSSNKEE